MDTNQSWWQQLLGISKICSVFWGKSYDLIFLQLKNSWIYHVSLNTSSANITIFLPSALITSLLHWKYCSPLKNQLRLPMTSTLLLGSCPHSPQLITSSVTKRSVFFPWTSIILTHQAFYIWMSRNCHVQLESLMSRNAMFLWNL